MNCKRTVLVSSPTENCIYLRLQQRTVFIFVSNEELYLSSTKNRITYLSQVDNKKTEMIVEHRAVRWIAEADDTGRVAVRVFGREVGLKDCPLSVLLLPERIMLGLNASTDLYVFVDNIPNSGFPSARVEIRCKDEDGAKRLIRMVWARLTSSYPRAFVDTWHRVGISKCTVENLRIVANNDKDNGGPVLYVGCLGRNSPIVYVATADLLSILSDDPHRRNKKLKTSGTPKAYLFEPIQPVRPSTDKIPGLQLSNLVEMRMPGKFICLLPLSVAIMSKFDGEETKPSGLHDCLEDDATYSILVPRHHLNDFVSVLGSMFGSTIS